MLFGRKTNLLFRCSLIVSCKLSQKIGDLEIPFMNASKRESCVKICAQELLPHSIAAGFIKEQFMMLNLQR